MGHLTNAKGFRVGKVVPWDYAEHRFKGDGLGNVIVFSKIAERLKRSVLRFFPRRIVGLFFSHCKIRRYGRRYLVRFYAFNGFFDSYLRYLRTVLAPKKRWKYVRLTSRQRWKRRSQRFLFYYFYKRPAKFVKRFRARRGMQSLGYRKRYLGYRGGWKERQLARKTPAEKRRIYAKQSRINAWLAVAKRKGHPTINRWTYRLVSRVLSLKLTEDFRKAFLPHHVHFSVRFVHQNFSHLTARTLATYIQHRIRLGYKLAKIVLPLQREAARTETIQGLFFKFKGRYSRKPRSAVNKKVFRYGRIGFSSVESKVDYVHHRFENRFGTCSMKIWLAKY